jgi:hypothetical protein
MVSDKLTLSLLSRLADAQLALAISMRGVTPMTEGYPEQDLQRVSHALEAIEVALINIGQFSSDRNPDTHTKLH